MGISKENASDIRNLLLFSTKNIAFHISFIPLKKIFIRYLLFIYKKKKF